MSNEKIVRRMNKKEFVLKAIHTLRKPPYFGIHVVFSGFNEAFRSYYEEDPIAEVEKLVADKVVVRQPVKGGVMLYDYDEYQKNRKFSAGKGKKEAEDVLKKILG